MAGYEKPKVGAKQVVSVILFSPVFVAHVVSTATYVVCCFLVCATLYPKEFKSKFVKNVQNYVNKTWKQ